MRALALAALAFGVGAQAQAQVGSNFGVLAPGSGILHSLSATSISMKYEISNPATAYIRVSTSSNFNTFTASGAFTNPVDAELFSFLPTMGTNGTLIISAVGGTVGTYILPNLTPNTTYFFTAAVTSGFTGTTLSLSSSTAAAVPLTAGTGGTFIAQSTESLTSIWLANSNPLAKTTYTVTLSTFPFLFAESGFNLANAAFHRQLSTLSVSGPAATISGLSPNTKYYLGVQATNHQSSTTGLGFLAPFFYTKANTPGKTGTTFASVKTSSAQVNYVSGTNPNNVSSYTVVFATGSCTPETCLGSVNLNVTTMPARVDLAVGSTATVVYNYDLTAGLSVNTTYTAYVGAITQGESGTSVLAYASLGSTATLAAQPTIVPANLGTFVILGSTRVTAHWDAAGNPSGTTFTVVASTASNFTATASPYIVSLATFPTLGATGNLGTATLTGLLPGTTYFYRVNAKSHGGALTDWKSLTGVIAEGAAGVPAALLGQVGTGVQTNAAAPAAAAATTVGTSSFTLNWGANDNPTGTTYFVQVSTDNFATFVNRNADFLGYASTTTSTSMLISPVSNGATFSARVWAQNTSRVHGATTTLAQVTTAGGSTGQAAPVADVSSATFVIDGTQGTSEIRAQWLTNGVSQTVYRAEISSDSTFATVNFASQTLNTFAVFNASLGSGISLPNSLYYFRVRSGTSTVGGNSDFVSLGSTYTLALPPFPLSTFVTNVSSVNARITWQIDINPPAYTVSQLLIGTHSAIGTPFTAFTSSKAAFGIIAGSAGSAVSLQEGLVGCTTYYTKVRIFNGNDVATAFDRTLLFVTSNTIPGQVGGFTATPLGSNQIKLDWQTGVEGVTQYNLYRTDTVVAPSTGSASKIHVFGSSVTTYTDTLSVSATGYHYKLTATHRCSQEDPTGATAIAAATTTLASLRAALFSPAAGDKVIGGAVASAASNLTLASTLNGNPLNLNTVTYQFKATTATAWADIGQSTVPPTYTVKWNMADPTAYPGGSGLAVGQTYQLRAVALDVGGSSDTFPTVITIDVVAPTVVGATSEQADAGTGVVTYTKTIDASVPNTLTCAGGETTAKFEIPSGAFPSNALITIQPNPAASLWPAEPTEIRISPTASLKRMDAYPPVRITASVGQVGTAALSNFYKDSDNNGVIDGTHFNVDSLTILRAPETATVPTTATYTTDGIVSVTVDKTNRLLKVVQNKTSFFAIFAQAAVNLDGVRVYPNPWKPNGSNADEGRPFVNGTGNTGIVFDRLPTTCEIKIYTVTGQLVTKFSQTNGAGTLVWDGRNDAGKNVASGGYLAVVSSPGSKRIVKRLAIIR